MTHTAAEVAAMELELSDIYVEYDRNQPTVDSAVEMLRAYAATLRQQAAVPGTVLVAITRGEGYECVHPDLVAEDAMSSAVERGWVYQVITPELAQAPVNEMPPGPPR